MSGKKQNFKLVESRSALYCRVLPPDEFNGVIPEPLIVCS